MYAYCVGYRQRQLLSIVIQPFITNICSFISCFSLFLQPEAKRGSVVHVLSRDVCGIDILGHVTTVRDFLDHKIKEFVLAVSIRDIMFLMFSS